MMRDNLMQDRLMQNKIMQNKLMHDKSESRTSKQGTVGNERIEAKKRKQGTVSDEKTDDRKSNENTSGAVRKKGIYNIFHEFWCSFDLGKEYLAMVFYDFVFVFSLFLLTNLSGIAVRWIQSMVSGIGLSGTLQSKSLAELKAIEGSTLAVAGATLGYFAVFFIAIILVFSLFEGLGWMAVLRANFSRKYFGKMCLLNTYLGLWLLGMLLLLSFLRTEDLLALSQKAPLIGQAVAAMLLLLLIVHPLLVSHVLLTRNPYHSVRSSLKGVFSIGYASLPSFILPYLLCWVLYQIIGLVSRFLTSGIASDRIALGIFIVIAVLYIAWMKMYLSRVILGISSTEKNRPEGV